VATTDEQLRRFCKVADPATSPPAAASRVGRAGAAVRLCRPAPAEVAANFSEKLVGRCVLCARGGLSLTASG
jgi:hypothetical protein